MTCNVLQPGIIKGFNQQEFKIYITMFHRAMNDPMSGLINTNLYEQILKGNKHNTKLPIIKALCMQHHDKKGCMHFNSNHIKDFTPDRKESKWKKTC